MMEGHCKRMKIKRIPLQTKLMILVCAVILVSLTITVYLIGSNAVENSKRSQEEKTMDIAVTMSHSKIVQDGLTGKAPVETIQPYAKKVQEATGVQYIVVLDKNRIRHSHPDVERIGQAFVGGDEDRAFEGEQYVSLAEGTLGESLRAFVPIYIEKELIGVVVVGILSENVQATVVKVLHTSYIGMAIGLFVGVVGAYLLAREVKQTLNGLEPDEIAKKLRQSDAVLQSVKEGIIAIDDEGIIIVANEAARQLFKKANIKSNPLGQSIDDYLPSIQLRRVLETGESIVNQEERLHRIDVVISRVPININDKTVGALATFRDKSALLSLMRQLSGVKAFAETLRIQTHEFMNKLHVITAMVHTKSYEELNEYTTYLVDVYQKEVGAVSRLVKDPVISGFLINKLSRAHELDIHTKLTGEHPLPSLNKIEKMDKIITVLGNLIDNANEAVRDQPDASIEMSVNFIEGTFFFEIEDNGPGFSSIEFEKKDTIGLTTKGENRGYGFYLIRKALDELGGTMEVETEEGVGTHFYISIPYEEDTDD